jgi:hypothetical protein
MKKYVYLVLIIVIVSTNPATGQPVKNSDHDKNSHSAVVVTMVKDFFQSFDDRD